MMDADVESSCAQSRLAAGAGADSTDSTDSTPSTLLPLHRPRPCRRKSEIELPKGNSRRSYQGCADGLFCRCFLDRLLIPLIPPSQLVGAHATAMETVLLLRQIVSTARFSSIEQLIDTVKGVGRKLIAAQPKGWSPISPAVPLVPITYEYHRTQRWKYCSKGFTSYS